MFKKGYVSLELIILTSIIVVAGITGYMVFVNDARENLDRSEGVLNHSIDSFNVDTKTKNKIK